MTVSQWGLGAQHSTAQPGSRHFLSLATMKASEHKTELEAKAMTLGVGSRVPHRPSSVPAPSGTGHSSAAAVSTPIRVDLIWGQL